MLHVRWDAGIFNSIHVIVTSRIYNIVLKRVAFSISHNGLTNSLRIFVPRQRIRSRLQQPTQTAGRFLEERGVLPLFAV